MYQCEEPAAVEFPLAVRECTGASDLPGSLHAELSTQYTSTVIVPHVTCARAGGGGGGGVEKVKLQNTHSTGHKLTWGAGYAYDSVQPISISKREAGFQPTR